MKLAVIGLDGASFELLDPWIEEGTLPNLKKVKEKGVWADLQSVLPPVTSPNWKSYATGKNPGKLGIFWWENIDFKNKKVYYPSERKFKNKEIWDHLGEYGYEVGCIGTPTTYPPKKLNGFNISGGPDAENKDFATPKSLEKKLKDEYDFKVRPDSVIDEAPDEAAEEIHEIIDKHFKIAIDLSEKYDVDFLQLSVFNINVLQHFFWDDENTKKGWQIIDNGIGKIMDRADNVLFMSDHGSNEIKTVFNINTWLEEQGYLQTKFTFSDVLQFLHIDKEKLAHLASKVGLKKILSKVLSDEFLQSIPSSGGQIRKGGKTSKLDWEKSKVFASGQGPVYLNPEKKDENLEEELIHKLQNLKSPYDGDEIIEDVFKKEEIFHGEYIDDAPDLMIDQSKGIHIPGGMGKSSVFEKPSKWRAENKKYGLFAAVGEDIHKEGKIENVSILDLAPTILDYFGITKPEDMDGEVLEVFENKLEPPQEDKEKEKIEKALDGLSI